MCTWSGQPLASILMVEANSHGARPVQLIITMIKWIRTSRLSINNSLSAVGAGGVYVVRAAVGLDLDGRAVNRRLELGTHARVVAYLRADAVVCVSACHWMGCRTDSHRCVILRGRCGKCEATPQPVQQNRQGYLPGPRASLAWRGACLRCTPWAQCRSAYK